MEIVAAFVHRRLCALMAQVLVLVGVACAFLDCSMSHTTLTPSQEASMADITYLFETGALVDFSVDELVRLVQALFADTALRATTIHKIQEGHPSAAVPEL